MEIWILGGSGDENWGYCQTPKAITCKPGRIAPGSVDDWLVLHVCRNRDNKQDSKGGMAEGGGEGNI